MFSYKYTYFIGFIFAFFIEVDNVSSQAFDEKNQSGDQLTLSFKTNDVNYTLIDDLSHHQLIIKDNDLNKVIRRINIKDQEGKQSRIAAFYLLKHRQSVIVVLADIPELWEMSYNKNAEPVYQGWVHDYQMGEGISDKELFAPRKIKLETKLECIIFDQKGAYVVGTDGHGRMQIINLDIRRKIADMYFSTPIFPCQSKIVYSDNRAILHLKAKEIVKDGSSNEEQMLMIEIRSGRIVKRLSLDAIE